MKDTLHGLFLTVAFEQLDQIVTILTVVGDVFIRLTEAVNSSVFRKSIRLIWENNVTVLIRNYVEEHLLAFSLSDDQVEYLDEVCNRVALALVNDDKTLFVAGNGGSAADSQHFAAELTGRFETNRRPLKGIALTTDTSAITAIGNDFGFSEIFARQLRALGSVGDIFVGITTSGNSKNILLAAEAARSLGMVVVLLTGSRRGSIEGFCDYVVRANSTRTSIIQEFHIFAIHCICRAIDVLEEDCF